MAKKPVVLDWLNAAAQSADPTANTIVKYNYDPDTGTVTGYDADGNPVHSTWQLAPLIGGTVYNVTDAKNGTGLIYTAPNGQDTLLGTGGVAGGAVWDANQLQQVTSALGIDTNIVDTDYQTYAATRGSDRFNLDAQFRSPATSRSATSRSATSAAAPASGFTPFAPTPYTQTGHGGADAFQPFGQGFADDYGLTDLLGTDPNFAFGAGSTAPPTPTPASTPATPVSVGGTISYTPPPGGFTGGNRTPNPGNFPGDPTIHYGGTPTAGLPTTGITSSSSPQTSGFRASPAVQTNSFQPVTTSGNRFSTGGTTSAAGGTTEQNNALASLRQTLDTYGLGSLADWAWQEIVAGKSEQQVMLDLMQRQEFKARFPAIEARQKAGLPPISPGEIVSYENQATQIMRAAGLPSGFWDSPADFTHLLSADVSISELQQRVGMATQAAYQVPPEVRATLARDYGVGAGQLAAFFLDEKTALPLIQRDFTAAQIGGAAYRTGYGSTKTEDEKLTDLGVTGDQAQQGFNQLVLQRQLFSSLPGENTTGISRDEQLGATFGGNALAQEKIVRRSRTRKAVFDGGGTFAATAGGFSGVGAARNA